MVQIASFLHFQIFVLHQQMCVQFVVLQIAEPIWDCHAVKKHYALIYKHNKSLLWDNRNKLSKVAKIGGYLLVFSVKKA